jgi:signal transduction histidine kinase
MRTPWRSPRLILSRVVAALLTMAVVALVWLSFRAVGEWRRSAERLLEERAEETVSLLAIALRRDMQGAYQSVLSPFTDRALDLPLYDIADIFARAFARFPYPESFFVWRDTPRPDGHLYVFNRVDRMPPWDDDEQRAGLFPVSMRENPAVLKPLIDTARATAEVGQRFTMFETTLAGKPYQVIVNRVHHAVGPERVHGLSGFLVNLEWVERAYFPELLRQISRIGGVEDSLSLLVLDSSGRVLASSRPGGGQELTADPERVGRHAGTQHARRFPLSFIDPTALSNGSASRRAIQDWTAAVGVVDRSALSAASSAASRTYWLVAIAAGAALLGLALALGALRAGTQLAAMKTDFIASATHELKTPLAAIQLVGDTLQKGRYHSEQTIRDYAGLLTEQSATLARLIDNMLAYASLNDVGRRYSFAPLGVADLLDEVLERFDPRLLAAQIELQMDVAADLPPVRADRQAILQVFDNVIDNAIKYSPGANVLSIAAAARNGSVHVAVADCGVGIPREERTKVFQRFYRGRAVTIGGSGLGLAIARQIVTDHGGEIAIRGREPHGTIVDITLPVHS